MNIDSFDDDTNNILEFLSSKDNDIKVEYFPKKEQFKVKTSNFSRINNKNQYCMHPCIF